MPLPELPSRPGGAIPAAMPSPAFQSGASVRGGTTGSPRHRILGRYFTREVLGPTLLTFLLYTFLMIMNQMALVTEFAYKYGVPVASLGKIVFLAIPHVVVLTLPMSLLAGILLATARMSADSELIALSANGVSILRLLRPLLGLALVFAALTTGLYFVVVPEANYKVTTTIFELFKQNVLGNLKEREFNTRLFSGYTIYVHAVKRSPGGDIWQGVLFDPGQTSKDRRELFFAREAQPQVDEESRTIQVLLRDVTVHDWTPGAKGYHVRTFRSYMRVLETPNLEKGRQQVSKSPREMTLTELRADLAGDPGRSPIAGRLLRVEIHKRFAIPLACVVFAVLGLALGASARRSGRSFAFVASLAVFLVYQQFFYAGERLAIDGKIPEWLSMWAGNLLFGGIGLLVLVQRASEGRAFRWVRPLDPRPWIARLPRPPVLRALRRDPVRLSVRNRRRGFPRILDRYVLGVFFRTLGLVLACSLGLYVQVSLFQLIDDIFRNHVPWREVVALYRYWLPEILTYVLPVSVLITTVITFSLLTRTNEIAALFLSGISIYRIVLPVLIAGVAITAATAWVYDPWLPLSNERYDDQMDIVRGNRPRSESFSSRWHADQGKQHFYTFEGYTKPTFTGLSVFEMDAQEFVPLRRTYASKATWDGEGDQLVLMNGWERVFKDGALEYTALPGEKITIGERQRNFGRQWRKPKTMTYEELSEYIFFRRANGLATRDLEIDLWNKRALPFVPLVMMIIALPFAFAIGRQGKLYGIGIAIVIAVVYWCAVVLAAYLGKVGVLPPALAAWSPNLAFALTGVAAFLGLRT